MAILNNLIVNGAARFLNKTYFDTIDVSKIDVSTIDATTVDINKLTADEATLKKGLAVNFKVSGELETSAWTNSNIAQVEGNFYLSPTTKSNCTITITGSKGNWTIAATGGTFSTTIPIWDDSSTTPIMTTSEWVVGSKVLITGTIAINGVDYPLGTCKGKISAKVTATGFTANTITSQGLDNIYDALGSIPTSGLTGKDIQISLYELPTGTSTTEGDYKPVGIFLTAYGKDKQTYIDIYGGTNKKSTGYTGSTSQTGMARPNVRIGHLVGLPSITVGSTSVTPTGWGIYTDNGYFRGAVFATSGKIGSWKVNSDSIASEDGTVGLNVSNSSGYAIWAGHATASSAPFSVKYDGTIKATAGTIGNFTLNSALYSNGHSAWNTNSSGIYINNDGIAGGPQGKWWFWTDGSAKIGQMSLSTAGVLTLGSISLSANGTATIGPWIVTSSSIYKGNATYGNASGMYFGDSGLSLGSAFQVTSAGVLSATGADLTGKVSATSGSIGGWQIGTDTNKSLHNGSANTSPTPAANVVILSKGITTTSTIGNLSAATYSITAGTTFGVTTNGVLTATSGRIGKFNLTNTYLSTGSGSTMAGMGGNQAFWAGNSSSDSAPFRVSYAGVLNATGATLTNLTIKDTTGVRVKVDTNGLIVYDGSGTADANIQAKFGSTVQVGKKAAGYITIVSNGIDMYAGDSNVNIAHLGYDDTKNESSIVKGKYFKFSSPRHEDPYTYNVNNTYSTGDEVYYNNKIYRCIVTQTTGNWNSNNWSEVTNGFDSFNIGYNTCASDRNSFAGGVTASALGPESFAFGNSCVAVGYNNFAIGTKTLAKGSNSCAFGSWTVSSGINQMAIGYWNVQDTTQDAYGYPDNIFIIGNGSSESNRSNAFIVNKSGNVKAKGRFYASSNSDSSGGSVVFDAGHTIDTNSTCLPQFSGRPSYLVGIEAFASGGTMKWQSTDNISVGYATSAGSATDSTKLPLAGGTLTGRLTLNTFNTAQVNIRPNHASYDGIMSYQTAGNEAWVFSTKNVVTSFMFVNGEDTVSNVSDSRWKSLTPGLQVKNNCVSIGKLIGDGVTPSYKLDVNGTINFTGLGTNAISNIANMFVVEQYSFSTPAISSGSSSDITVTGTKTGYHPLSISGFQTGRANAYFAKLVMTQNGESFTINGTLRANAAVTAGTGYVYVLWVKYS